MNIRISPSEAKRLYIFLQDCGKVRMDKKRSQLISRLLIDIRELEVNSQRLAHVMPLVLQLIAHFRQLSASNLRYSKISKTRRLFVLPALVKYLLKIVPARRRYALHLDDAERIFLDLVERGGKK